ncbi:MAG: GNAT family N-acetyltransferase [Ruminiclostridium sp.]
MNTAQDIPEIKDLWVMQKKDIESFSDCFADGFCGCSLMNYFYGGECDEKKTGLIWEVSIRAYKGQLLGVGDSERPNAAALFAPPEAHSPGLLTYIRAGGLKLVRNFGLKGSARMQSFETFTGKFRKRYMTNNCWYLFGFVSRRESRGQGYGARVLSPVLSYFDRTGRDCYLETLDEKNIALYEHFGFELMESSNLPDSRLTVYSMLRKAKK